VIGLFLPLEHRSEAFGTSNTLPLMREGLSEFN
jgi:hypothetical protein